MAGQGCRRTRGGRPSCEKTVYPSYTRPTLVVRPTAGKAIDGLIKAGVLAEVGERKRDRLYRYEGYLRLLD